MALFKKKKEEETDSGFSDGIGLTGSLAESKKPGLFGKKKEQLEQEPSAETTSEAEETIECGRCGMLCPVGMDVCEICGNDLAGSKPGAEESGQPGIDYAQAPLETGVSETTEPEPGIAEESEVLPDELPARPEPETPGIQVPAAEPQAAETPTVSREIPIRLETVEEEPKAPAWKPLPEKERKAAEKAIKRDIKTLDKQLKKNQISKEEHDRRIKALRVDYGLEPPKPVPVKATPPVAAAPARQEPAPQPEPTMEEEGPMPDFREDISIRDIDRGTELVDTAAEPSPDVEKEVDEIVPIELLALEELVEEEPEPAEQPAPEPEPEKKVGFVASRKIFGDKKKQLEEWEESLRGEEQNLMAGKADLDNRELRLQEKNLGIQTELQILQTKKKDMAARAEIMEKREAELQQIGAKLAQQTEALDLRDAEISKRESSISDKITALDAREAELSERISILEKKEKEIIARESETREKWLDMREFDRKITARSEELDSAEEEINEKRMAQRKRDAELDDKRRELDARGRELEAKARELSSLQEQIAAREEKLVAEVGKNQEVSKKMEETFLKIEEQREELQAKESDMAEREERMEAWKKRLEAKESELAVKANELSSKEGAVRSAEREMEDRKNKLKSRLMELKSLEDQTLIRKREVDEVELLLIQKENELFNREQGLNRKEAAK